MFTPKIRAKTIIPLVILSFIASFSLSAQIIIKDTVEIKPSTARTDSNRITKGNKQQGKSFVNQNDDIIIQDGERVRVTLIERNSATPSDVVLKAPYHAVIFSIYDYGVFQWISERALGPTQFEFGLEWEYNGWHTEVDKRVMRVNDTLYSIAFEDNEALDDYNDVIISVAVIKKTDAPDVSIVYPNDKEKFILTAFSQPVIACTESHYPRSGSPQEPAITWSPGQVINTADYYDLLISEGWELEVPIKATAVNAIGTASDLNTVQLIAGINHFRITATPSEIEHDQMAGIAVTAINAAGEEMTEEEIPWDTPLRITVTPSNYGHFDFRPIETVVRSGGPTGQANDERMRPQSNSKSVQLSSKTKQNKNAAITTEPEPFEFLYESACCLVFVADGENPPADMTITITVQNLNDPAMTGKKKVIIRQRSCPVLEFSKNPIGPGEIAEVRVKRKFDDNTTADYPAGTKFLISKLWESVNDMVVLLGSEDGNNVIGTEPARFVANENIEAESVIITVSGAPVDWQNVSDCPEPTASLVITKELETLCPIVSIVPEEIEAGETAEVIVTGTPKDYPPGTQFTFSMQSGSEAYGAFTNGGTTITTASPALFIAKDEIAVDEGTFTISVAVASGASAKIMGNQISTEPLCPPDGGKGSGKAKRIKCPPGTACASSDLVAPKTSVATKPNGFGGENLSCKTGQGGKPPLAEFMPAGGDAAVEFDANAITVCCNQVSQNWIVQMPLITFNTIIGLCENNTKDLTDLETTNILAMSNLDRCYLKAGLKDVRNTVFTTSNGTKYYLKGATLEHEFHHQSDYLDNIEKAVQDAMVQLSSFFKISKKEYKTEAAALAKAKKNAQRIIELIKNNAGGYRTEQIGEEGSPVRAKYEADTQKKVEDTYRNFITSRINNPSDSYCSSQWGL